MSSSREKAWRNSDGFKERETIQDRMKKMNLKPILPWTKEGKKTREEFAEKYGRGWYLFTDLNTSSKHKNQWICQYYKPELEDK